MFLRNLFTDRSIPLAVDAGPVRTVGDKAKARARKRKKIARLSRRKNRRKK